MKLRKFERKDTSYFVGSPRISEATQKQELKIRDWKTHKSRLEAQI